MTTKEIIKMAMADKGFDVEYVRMNKLNGGSFDGYKIKSGTAYPVMRIESLEAQLEGVIDEIANRVEETIATADKDVMEIPEIQISSYAEAKTRLYMAVYGADRNEEKLKTVPHRMIADMAIVYRVGVGNNASFVITNEIMEKWGVTEFTLYADATDNMNIESFSLGGFIAGMTGSDNEDATGMWVARTAEREFCGAGVIGLPNFFEEIGRKLRGDFYLLPSSIHEVLLLPDGGDLDLARDLVQMVKDINEAQVDPSEQLTDNAYHYEVESDTFEQVSDYLARKEVA